MQWSDLTSVLYAANSTPTAVVAIYILSMVLALYVAIGSKSRGDSPQPPLATPHVPILGNALEYKKCPATFLTKTAKRCGPVFRLDLAGMQTTIVCSPETMQQFAFAPESVLSARAAVRDLGFDSTLGEFNVARGTDIHKKIIKLNYASPAQLENTAQELCKHIDSAITHELGLLAQPGIVPDFLGFVRKVVLSSLIDEMLGHALSSAYSDRNGGCSLVEDFIVLQDGIEDATARAAVLPRWAAGPACLWAAAHRRDTMAAALLRALEGVRSADSSEHGVWLRDIFSSFSHLPLSNVAELIVGLLFAAHKNAAIAAAQTVLMVLQRESPEVRRGLTAESRHFVASAVDGADGNRQPVLQALEQCGAVELALRETLRLTAHAIGAMRKVMKKGGWRLKAGDTEYVIPEGSYVGATHIVPNVADAVWGEESSKFDPLRQVAEGAYENDFTFTTFSHGVHKCPGSRIARMIGKLVVALLFGRYQLSVPEGEPLPAVSFERATLAQRAGPCVVHVLQLQRK